MKFETWRIYAEAAQLAETAPALRKGQALWTVAIQSWPKIAGPLHGTAVDPFYDDAKIPAFVAALERAALDEEGS